MEAKDIQKLLDFIANSGLDEVNIETEAFKVSTKRNSGKVIEQVYTQAAPQQVYAPQVQAAPVAQAPAAAPSTSAAAPAADETSKYVTIKSPMIGTFYSSPKPEIDAFVSAGSDVSKGQVVCIIEAMKLFNEIESDISGRIVKVLVDNATPVEFDQPLFLVDPS
ncbi:MAG: acetyl-CoA carboxylase biotin carboxyl carrier protein [Bacteroidota bacterium]|jgi:acetyl-CoA carboxylase biotin carboxyl carrier protein